MKTALSRQPARFRECAGDAEVELVASANIPTRYGMFNSFAYRVRRIGVEHIAFVMGDVSNDEPVLTRLHSECLTGDTLGSYRCDCGEQLDRSLRYIAAARRGILIYLRGHEGRGIGLANKIRAYALQEQGLDTVDANLHLGLPNDSREYDSEAEILRSMNVKSVRLTSNNPLKFDALLKYDISVCERVSLAIRPRVENELYIRAKQERFGHYLDGSKQAAL